MIIDNRYVIQNCRYYIIRGQNFYRFINRCVFIQNERKLHGIPKIALKKSGTRTLKKICGSWPD